MDPFFLIWGIVLPAVISALILVIGWRPWRRTAHAVASPRDGGSAVAALAIGYIVGHWTSLGGPGSTADISVWVIYLCMGAAILGLTQQMWGRHALPRWFIRVGASSVAAWLIFRPLIGQSWGVADASLGIVGVGFTIVLIWSILDYLTERETGASLLVSLLGVGAIGSAGLIFSATATTGQAAGIVLTVGGVLLLFSWRYPRVGQLAGIAPVVTVVLVSQWTIGFLYAEMPWGTWVLLAAGMAALIVSRLAAVRELKPVLALVIRVGLSGTLALGGAGLAAKSYFGSGSTATDAADRPGGNDYGYDEDYGYE